MTRRLRVLHLVSSLTVGGAEQIVLNLAENVNPDHFETHVCSLSVVAQNRLQSEFERLDIPLLSLNARRFYDPQAIRAVFNYVRRQQIDLIHTHLTDADIIGRFVGRALRVPVLSTMHNMPHNYAQQRRDRYWLERITARHLVTHLAAVSPKIRELYIRQWHIRPAQISAIFNSVRMDAFLALPAGVAAGRPYPGPVIATVARLSPQKAQHVLLAAAARVLQRYPQARFLLVGSGHMEQPLRRQAQELGIAGNVDFLGIRHDVPDILAQSDCFVLSSNWEGLPLSAIEAMAAARPVVLTDVGGNDELVESGQSGLLIPPEDEQALAAAIVALLADEPARRRLGHAARARVRRLFSTEQFVQQYEALYTQLGRKEQPQVSERSGEVPL